MTWQQRKGGGKSFTREFDQRDHSMVSTNALNAAVAAVGFEIELGKITGELNFDASNKDAVTDRILKWHEMFYGLHLSKVEGSVQEAVAATVRQIPNAEPQFTAPARTPDNGLYDAATFVIGFGKYKGKTLAEAYDTEQQYVRSFLATVMEPNNETGRQAQEAARAYITAIDAA